MKQTIRIGCGAGFSGDRLEPAVDLAARGKLDYLVLECLAERTIALAQKRKLQDPQQGYDPFLERRIASLLPYINEQRFVLVTNMGAANPVAAAEKATTLAAAQNMKLKIAAVWGDDVLDRIDLSQPAMETGLPLSQSGKFISANAYLGVEGILQALDAGADIIITGRVADPSLFLAPMMHSFQWDKDDFDILGKGTVVGHLLECAGHLTGGYFSDGNRKQVPRPEQLGHPLAEIARDGSAIITKLEDTGGTVNLMTAKEQLLYEVINPSEYYTPDVIADFTSVRFCEVAPDRIQVSGGTGKARPAAYKASLGYPAFFLGEGEISYAGYQAMERARQAGDTIRKRIGHAYKDFRCDYIGTTSAHHTDFAHTHAPYEIRLRVAGKASTAAQAALIGEEVEALYTNGPAGGGGARKYIQEVIGIVSTLIDRTKISPQLTLFTS